MYRFQLPQIKARIERLRELTENLGKEVTAQKATEGLLLPLEQRQYLGGLQDGLEGLDAARVVLALVVKRMEREARERAGQRSRPQVGASDKPGASNQG